MRIETHLIIQRNKSGKPEIVDHEKAEDMAIWSAGYNTKEYGDKLGPARAVLVEIELPDDLLDVPTARVVDVTTVKRKADE